uniref:Uncharacterized protein n=1 Tax=Chenopodium quinoa TaxID=63459 RepID=A0A803N8G0_CHEQI
MYEMPLSGNYVCVVYDHSTQQKVKLVPCKGLDVIFNRDSFSNVCSTIGYDGAFCLIDDEEDALSLLSMAEKNVGAHLSTPSNFQCPIYLDDLSDDEDLHVAHLTRADHGAVTLVGNPEVMNVSTVGKSVLHLDEEEGIRLDGFTIHNIRFDSSSSWKEEEETEEDREEDLEEDEETEEDPKEETEEDPEEELQENENDYEINPQGARDGTNWSNEDGVEEEPKTPKDSDPCFRGESWISNSFKHDEGSRKRSRAEDFDLDFDVLCYRRLVYPEELILFPNYRHVDRYLNLPQFEKFNGLGDPILHLYNFVNTLYPLNVPEEHFPMLFNRSLGGPALSWYYTSGERRPKVHPQGERANRRIFTRIDKPLSVVYDRLSKKGILRAKSYVYSLPPHGTDMRQYCSYCHLYGHRTDTCYDLKCEIQDLIDRGIITPAHPQSSIPETSPAQLRASQADLFLQLLEEGRIKPLPRRAGADPVGPNLNKYCHYHQLHGHDTNECHALRWCIKRTTGISCPNQKVSINSLSLWTHEDDPTLLIARHYSNYEKDC